MTSLSSSITGAPSYPPLLSLPLTLPKWESLSPSLRLPLSRPCSHRPSLRGPLTFPHLGSLTQFLTQAPSYTPYFKLPGNLSHSGSLSPSVILTSLSPSLTAAPAHPHSPRLPLTLSHSALSHLPSLSCFLTLTHSGCHPHSLEIPLTLPHLGSL